MPLVLKKVSSEKIKMLKIEAIRRGISLSQAIEEAIELWVRLGGSSGVVEDEFRDDLFWEERKNEFIKKYYGKYIVIANGRIAGVFDTLNEVSKFLKEQGFRRRVLVVHVGVDKEGWVGEWWGGSIERISQ